MKGFFTKKQMESKTRPDGKSYSCISCQLYRKCDSPKMKPFGKFKKGILNIGEAPGATEDQVGKPWQGKAGRLLQATYKELGVDLFEDCLNINSVCCRPTTKKGGNRTPDNFEIACCRKYILKVIEEHKPKIVILLGNAAIFSVIGHRWKKDLGGVSKWRGWTIPDQDFKVWICPTFHPSYILRSENSKYPSGVEKVIWMQDLQKAFLKQHTLSVPVYKEPTINIITDLYQLSHIKTMIAFDYETTGLKPHGAGHRIVSCAIATNENYVYVFMMPKTKKERLPLLHILGNKKIPKIAQSMKYEHAWSKVRLRTIVKGWFWDTMIASHILDNRPGITSLKFQTYVQFGVVDYSSEVDVYIKDSDKTNSNSFNKILDLIKTPEGIEKLLRYNAYDSINEYRLAMLQKQEIYEDELPF